MQPTPPFPEETMSTPPQTAIDCRYELSFPLPFNPGGQGGTNVSPIQNHICPLPSLRGKPRPLPYKYTSALLLLKKRLCPLPPSVSTTRLRLLLQGIAALNLYRSSSRGSITPTSPFHRHSTHQDTIHEAFFLRLFFSRDYIPFVAIIDSEQAKR